MLTNLYRRHPKTINNFVWKALQNFGRQGTGFAIFFISASFLSPQDLGRFSYFLAVLSLLVIFCDFGVASATARYVAEYAVKEPGKLKKILFSSFLVTIGISSVISLLVVVVGREIFAENYAYILLFLPYLYLGPLASITHGVYQGLRKFKATALISCFAGAVTLVVAFFAVQSYGLVGAILSQNLLWLLLLTLHLVFYREFELKFDAALMKELLKYSALIGLANVGVFFNTKIDILIMKEFGLLVEIGYYELINKIFMLFLIPYLILGQVTAPVITGLYAQGQKAVTYLKFKKYLLFALLTSVLISAFAYFALPPLVNMFLAKYYVPELLIMLQLLLLILPAKVIQAVAVNCFIIPTGHARIFTVTTVVFGALNVVLDIVLISVFGYLGVVYASLLLAYGSLLTIFIIYRRRIRDFEPGLGLAPDVAIDRLP
jgi:O-antigen/teichoic acid export membrane protein